MSIDLNLLNLGFETLGTASTGGDLLQALTQPGGHYVLIADRLRPGDQPKLVARLALVENLLAGAIRDVSVRRHWALLLQKRPEFLPLFIAQAMFSEDNSNPPAPDVEGPAELAPAIQIKVEGFIEQERDKAAVVPVIEVESERPQGWPHLFVVVRGDDVLGVFDRRALDVSDWGAVPDSQPTVRRKRGKPPQTEAPPRKHEGPPSILDVTAGDDVATASTAVSESTRPFTNHPRLTPEDPVRAGLPLHFKVGFSDRPDADADEQRRILIKDARPGETLLVVVSAEGASMDGETFAELPLDLGAEHRFTAQVGVGVAQVMLRAQYLFRNKLVGNIVKTLAVAGATTASSSATTSSPRSVDGSVGVVRPLADVDAIDPADIFLWVQNEQPGVISWSAYVSASAAKFGPFRMHLDDSQGFAKQLAGLRGLYGDCGNGARDELFGIGKTIAECIPPEIIDKVLTPALGASKPAPPSILLLTDQAFVPWELARLSGAQAARDGAVFLGEVARIGRWWTRESSSGPPSQTRIEHVSAVAASQYGLATNLQTLKYAIEERDALRTTYQAQPVEARRPDVDEWLDHEPRSPGHLAHIALHGYSDPLADVQGLVLGDGAVLTPNRLAGTYEVGQTPRFAVVFLNACQVGTGGAQLGRMAGFPGAMVRGGVSGFIAPLWEVQDEVARDVSHAFYKRTLIDGMEVGEALRAMRAETVAGGSITPWAYLFYGHPRLRLMRVKPPLRLRG